MDAWRSNLHRRSRMETTVDLAEAPRILECHGLRSARIPGLLVRSILTCVLTQATGCASRCRTSSGCRPGRPAWRPPGEISLRHLVREALRMRPQRIVVGEVRQQECLDLLIALNSGIPGMCTVHANSEAVTKMCTLPLLAGENSGGLSVFRTATTTGVARSPMALRRRSCGFTVVNIGVQPVSQPCLHGARRADSRGSTDAEPRLQPGRPVGPHLAPRLIDYPVAQPRSRGRGRAP